MNSGNSIRYNNFNKFIHDNNLIDLAYNANAFTWHIKRENEKPFLPDLIVHLRIIYG